MTIQIHRILCPVDFSDFSQRALEHAVAIARWYESTVTMLHVGAGVPLAASSMEIGFPPVRALPSEERDELLAVLKQFAAGVSAETVPIEFDVSQGPTAAEILKKSETMPADLLVMGTHGRSGFERLILGSVTERVLRKAACPVLTVPKGLRDEAPGPLVLFKQIVCAIDFSDCSMRALNYAMSLAKEADARLTVVHVIELPPDLPREVHETVLAGPRNLHEYIASAKEDRLARLTEVIPETVRAHCIVDTTLAAGTPYREILRVAEERKADLLVVGVHGRGAVDRMLFGSTAQHLVRQASCPVLTLRTG